jgi:hypothetical protein
MPFYDRACPDCAWIARDRFEPIDAGVVPCPDCGAPTVRAWFTTANVIGDECDFVSHHGETQPVRFRSKQAHKRWLKAHGYRIKDAHVGSQGSDKSKLTASAVVLSQHTLDEAKALLERVGQAGRHEGALGITSFEGLTRYLGDRRRAATGEYV